VVYHKVEAWPPTLGFDGKGSIIIAMAVLGRIDGPNGTAQIHIATWEAGRGQREDKITPAEYMTWKASVTKPLTES
jgi:hypothetical protein